MEGSTSATAEHGTSRKAPSTGASKEIKDFIHNRFGKPHHRSTTLLMCYTSCNKVVPFLQRSPPTVHCLANSKTQNVCLRPFFSFVVTKRKKPINSNRCVQD